MNTRNNTPSRYPTEALKFALNMLIEKWELALFSIIYWIVVWVVGAQIAYIACHGYLSGVKPTLGLEDNYIALMITNLLFGSPWGAYDPLQRFYYRGDPKEVFYSFLELWPVLLFCIVFIPLLVLCLETALKKVALQVYDTGHSSIKTMLKLPLLTILKLAPFFMLIGCAQIGHFFLRDWLKQSTLFNILTPYIMWYLLLLVPLSYISFRLAFVALFMIDQYDSLINATRKSLYLTRIHAASFWTYLWPFTCAWILANTTAPALWGALAIWVLSFSETYLYRTLLSQEKDMIYQS